MKFPGWTKAWTEEDIRQIVHEEMAVFLDEVEHALGVAPEVRGEHPYAWMFDLVVDGLAAARAYLGIVRGFLRR